MVSYVIYFMLQNFPLSLIHLFKHTPYLQYFGIKTLFFRKTVKNLRQTTGLLSIGLML